MLNVIWPRTLSSEVGATGLIGRTIHWLGVITAAAFLIAAIGFAVDGWSTIDAIWLTAIAFLMAMASRWVRYLLARE